MAPLPPGVSTQLPVHRLPLQAAWPVHRIDQSSNLNHHPEMDELATESGPPAADEDLTPAIMRALPPAQPTSSAVEVITPRRPRPVGASWSEPFQTPGSTLQQCPCPAARGLWSQRRLVRCQRIFGGCWINSRLASFWPACKTACLSHNRCTMLLLANIFLQSCQVVFNRRQRCYSVRWKPRSPPGLCRPPAKAQQRRQAAKRRWTSMSSREESTQRFAAVWRWNGSAPGASRRD